MELLGKLIGERENFGEFRRSKQTFGQSHACERREHEILQGQAGVVNHRQRAPNG